MTTSDAPTAREQFIASQVDGLEPLDFVLVGVPRPPFDAVQVLREEDGSLHVELSARDASIPPLTDDQLAALARLGVPIAGGGGNAASGAGPASIAGAPVAATMPTVTISATGAPPAPAVTAATGAPAAGGAASSQAGAGSGAAATPSDAAGAARLIEAVLTEVLGVDGKTPVDIRHGSEREARLAEQRVTAMRSCIEPVLAKINGGTPALQDDDGDYVLDIGHVRIFVAPRSLPGRPPPIIRVFAITNAGVNLTPELGLFLARLNFSLMFGRFSIDAENAAIWFDETLLGEHVTEEELRFTVEMVATTANEWDQKIAGMFGGRIRTPDTLPPVGTAAAPADAAPTNKPGQGGYL